MIAIAGFRDELGADAALASWAGRRSRALICRLLVIVGIPLALWIPYSSSYGSGQTEIGGKEMEVWRLLASKSVLTARLTERGRGPSEPYLVFEPVRPLHGVRISKTFILVEPDLFGVVDQAEGAMRSPVEELVVGRNFILRLGDEPEPRLLRVPEAATTGSETRLTESYETLTHALQLDPWTAAESSNVFVRACVYTYFAGYASPREIETLLRRYVTLDHLSGNQNILLQRALEGGERQKLPLPPELIMALYAKVSKADPRASILRAAILGFVTRRSNAATDRLLVDALDSPDRDVRIAALEALTSRRLPEAVTGIHKSLLGIPTPFFGTRYERTQATRALVYQSGEPGIDWIVTMCTTSIFRNAERAELFDAIRPYVGRRHIATIRRWDDRGNPEYHAQIWQLLLAAGDSHAPLELLRCAKSWSHFRLPNPEDPTLLNYPTAWAPIARYKLTTRSLTDGSQFISAATVLQMSQDDHETSRLLIGMIDDDFFRPWVVRFLAATATSRYRGLFRRLSHDEDRLVRVYAQAGLARISDTDDDLLPMITASACDPDSYLRYVTFTEIIPMFDSNRLLRVWAAHRPADADGPEAALHTFVTHCLEAAVRTQAKSNRSTDIQPVDAGNAGIRPRP